MSAASTSDARKRNGSQVDPVEVVAKERFEDLMGEGAWDDAGFGDILRDAMRVGARRTVSALRENGFTL